MSADVDRSSREPDECPRCGALLPDQEEEGLCPRCGTAFGFKTTVMPRMRPGALEGQGYVSGSMPGVGSSAPPMARRSRLVTIGLILALVLLAVVLTLVLRD